MTVAQVFKAWRIFGGDPKYATAARAEWLIEEVTAHPDYTLHFGRVNFYSNVEFRKWVELL